MDSLGRGTRSDDYVFQPLHMGEKKPLDQNEQLGREGNPW